MKLRHNKRRNSGLLYEFLVHYVSKCLINSKTENAEKALEISKKYFGKGRPLNEELKLYRSVLDTNVKSRHSAEKLINHIYESSKKLNARELDMAKSHLIKEINYTLKDEDLYNYKIPNYVVYASISALLTESRNKKKNLTEVQKIQLEDILSEHLVKEKITKEQNIEKDPKYRKNVYRFVVERFHKKYDQKLTESQKKLLTVYATYRISKNDSDLKKILVKESDAIRSKLSLIKDENIREDKDLMNKLKECRKKFETIDVSNVTEEVVLEILKYMELVNEVESNEQ